MRFELLTTEYLAHLYAGQPVMATEMGVHDYDDLLPDAGPFAAEDELRDARAYLHSIDKLSLAGMRPDDRIDYRIARASTHRKIVDLEQIRRAARRPADYVETLVRSIVFLIHRDFAAPELRGECLLRRLLGASHYLAQARGSIADPPLVAVESAIDLARAAESWMTQEARRFAESITNATLAGELVDAGNAASSALRDYRKYLKDAIAPKSCEAFAVGPEVYDYALRVGELQLKSGAELADMARDTIARIDVELIRAAESNPGGRAIVREVRIDGSQSGMASLCMADLDRARSFVIEKGLVSARGGEKLRVTFAGEDSGAAILSATYVPGGPFEADPSGMLVIASKDCWPSATWSSASAAIDTAGPAAIDAYGRHLQASVENLHESRFRRHFGRNRSLTEGWALYFGELMHESGFMSDSRVRVLQLQRRRRLAARLLADVEMHCRGMSVSEAAVLIVDLARIGLATARKDAVECACWPATSVGGVLGLSQIQELRTRVERRQGPRFSLRGFHDALLSYGAIPPRLIIESMTSVA